MHLKFWKNTIDLSCKLCIIIFFGLYWVSKFLSTKRLVSNSLLRSKNTQVMFSERSIMIVFEKTIFLAAILNAYVSTNVLASTRSVSRSNHSELLQELKYSRQRKLEGFLPRGLVGSHENDSHQNDSHLGLVPRGSHQNDSHQNGRPSPKTRLTTQAITVFEKKITKKNKTIKKNKYQPRTLRSMATKSSTESMIYLYFCKYY